MTRVLVLTSLYPPHHLGGAELSCHDVATRLRERGHDVAVLCAQTRLPGVVDDAGDDESSIERRLQLYLRDGEPYSPSLWRRLGIERHNQAVLAEVLDRFRPEVVSVWHMGAMSLGLLTALAERGVPLVYAVCDEWPAYEPILDCWARLWWGSPVRRATGRVARRLAGVPTNVGDLGRTGAFLWVSELTRQRVLAHSQWTYPRGTVVYSGIDPRLFPIVTSGAARPWRWNLVYAGRFDPRKGPETAVRALAHLPDEAHLSLYGKGGHPERDRLRDLAAELGLGDRVTFGEVDRAELAEIYRGADAVVFPSEWEEPFGLVPVEAMACGAPVVATGTGGSREFLFEDRNYLRIPPRDPAALAAALRRLAESPSLRAELVAGGQATAAQLSVDRLADVFEQWHHAAAVGFRDGEPPPREPVRIPR